MIELIGRVGANCLPELVQISFGIEYYKMIAAMAVGENPLELWNKKSSHESAGLAKMMLSTNRHGVLKDIKYTGRVDDDVLENSNDCIGQVVVKGNDLESRRSKVDQVLSRVHMDLE